MVAIQIPPPRRTAMALIHVTVIDRVFAAPQKQEIVERLRDAMVAIEGESMRRHISWLVEQVGRGAWGVGGQTLAADDVKALARSEAVAP
jgi:4-oxalocrotonate tautomerase